MTIAVIVLAAMVLADANGSNDNFKGVATLFGSGTTSRRGAVAKKLGGKASLANC